MATFSEKKQHLHLMLSLKNILPVLLFTFLFCNGLYSQSMQGKTDAWEKVKQEKKGTVSVLWYDIEPFIYRNKTGGIIGVEYELMEGFKGYLKQKYGIQLDLNWVDATSFENIYPQIKNSKEKGLFGVSFYSITNERKKEVKFSPPYMPDLNILVTNNSVPLYETDKQFISNLTGMKGFTMKQTTMEEDLMQLKNNYAPALPVSNEIDDYEVLKQIAESKNGFGYVPVSIYVVALQRDIKVKRQRVLSTRREGFAAIYTKASDWDEPINEYFNSPECKTFVLSLISKYLGTEIADIILNVSGADSVSGKPSDIELLTKEREIVTQRLIDTAVDAQSKKNQRNLFLITAGIVLLLALILYSRFREKTRLHKLLQQSHATIFAQNGKIEEMNQQLKMKILQSRLNPHFLFNSLNAIQYFVGVNEKRSALQYINRFSAFIRQVLTHGDELLITVEQEALMAEQYLWLEQSRFPDRFTYTIEVDAEAAKAQLPPLLIHSIIEEALYVEMLSKNKSEKGNLYIRFRMQPDNLEVMIQDDGLSKEEVAKAQDTRSKSMLDGNSILEKRMQLINGIARLPVQLIYERSNEQNITRLTIPQPLFSLS